MKTVARSMTYWKGLGVGIIAGLPLAAAFASVFGGKSFSLYALLNGSTPRPDDVAGATAGAIVGMFLGLVLGVAGAALMLSATSREAREQIHEPGPVVEDGGLNRTFPGVFGSADPYEPFKRRIEAEEGKSLELAPPESMPEACPSCGKKLDADADREKDDPVGFCYHCGAALA
jgi:hypothetical protein